MKQDHTHKQLNMMICPKTLWAILFAQFVGVDGQMAVPTPKAAPFARSAFSPKEYHLPLNTFSALILFPLFQKTN